MSNGFPEDRTPPEAERTLRLGPPVGCSGFEGERFHGRSAARFVYIARTFDAEIRIQSGEEDAEPRPEPRPRDDEVSGDAKSMFGVGPFVGIRPGYPLHLRAWGPDAVEAVMMLCDVLEDRERLWVDDPSSVCVPGLIHDSPEIRRQAIEKRFIDTT